MISKNTNNQQTSFWKFIQTNKIEIPIIQRDYAQGRIGKEKLREKFLSDLKNAIESNTKLKLDFVYGSIENDSLHPLDGQQRLTTLWLLHWYIALKAGVLNEVKDNLKRFTYETRVSSREFCENLCSKDFNPNENVVEQIEKQTWFYSAWKQDPTIQAILQMLGGTTILDEKNNDIPDGLEEIFKDCKFKEYWEKLISNECPIIFYYMPLHELKLSDDLYIKMNARGKTLTGFENFKADLVGYIKDKKWEEKQKPKDTIAHKLDTTWTNIFWKYKSPKHQIDEIYFTFLKRYFLNSLIVAKSGDDFCFTAENLEKDKSFKNIWELKSEYFSFEVFNPQKENEEIFGKEVSDRLICVLDNFHSEFHSTSKEEINQLFHPLWDNKSEFRFIPEYENESNDKYKPTLITQQQRVVVHAICRYFEEAYNVKSFKEWMRVVWNIVENANINSIQSMIGAMRLLDELGIHSHDIYNWLANPENEIISNVASEQVKEEREKASLIINDVEWEEKIIEAEKFAFFKGAIRFLLKDEQGNWNSDNFVLKFQNCKKYFDVEGVKEPYKSNAHLLKAIISRCPQNDFERLVWWDKYIFDNKAETWRKNYLLNSDWAQAVHELLLGQYDIKFPNTTLLYSNLFKSDLLNHVAENMPGSRMRWIHNHKALYQPRYQGIILDDENYHRNEILIGLYNNGTIECSQKIDKIPFFMGWDINFKYKSKWFQWNTDDKIHALDSNKNRITNENDCISIKDCLNWELLQHELDNFLRSH